MAEEIIFKVSTDTGNSVKSVSDVEKALKGVSGETKDVQKTFTDLRNEIKKQTADLAGITKQYGEGSKVTEKFKKDLDALKGSYADLSKSNVDLGAKFEDVHGELQPLSSRLGEVEDRMYELALANKTNTAEYKTLQDEVVKYRQTIISVDRAVDQLAEQGRGLGAALQIGTAVTAGYGALQGGMALLGNEGEELQETFVKLQAAQTILASLEQLKLSLDKQSIIVIKAKAAATVVMSTAQTIWTAATTGTTVAMGILNATMMAMPIIAIIAGIIALVAVIYQMVKANEVAEEMNNRVTASLEKHQAAFERLAKSKLREVDNMIATAQAEGASAEELHQLELKRMEREEVIRKAQTKIYKIEIDQRKQAYKQALKEGNSELATTIKEEIKTVREKYKDIRNLDGQYAIDKKNKETEFAREQLEAQKAEQDKRNQAWKTAQDKRKAEEEKAAQDALARQRLLSDLMVANIEDEQLRTRTALIFAQQREREDLIAKYGEDVELLKQLKERQANEILAADAELKAKQDAIKLADDLKAQEETDAAISAVNRDHKAQLELELLLMAEESAAKNELRNELNEVERQIALENKNLTESEIALINEQYRQKEIDAETVAAEKKKQLQEDVKDASIQTAQAGLDAIVGISDILFEDQLNKAEKGSSAELAIKKKQFEVNKKLQIAQAIMQGVQAVQAAYSSGSAIPIVGAVTGPLFAVLAGVQSVLNINKIKNTKFDGGGGSVSTPSVSAPSIPSASSVLGGDNDSTLTAGLAGSGTGATGTTQPSQPPIKVNIVDSDMKAGLDNAAKVEALSTIG